MKFLNDLTDIENFMQAVDACNGGVVLRSIDGKEEFNLKSELSRRVAISRLCGADGEDYEVFCLCREDMGPMLNFFHAIREKKKQAVAAM